VVKQHLKDGQLGHVVRHAGLVGCDFGFVDRQTREAGFDHQGAG
jgi:hypothetical protein